VTSSRSPSRRSATCRARRRRSSPLEKDADSLEQRAGRLEKLAGLEPEPRRQLNDDPDHDDEPKIANTLAEFNEQRAGVLPQDEDEYRRRSTGGDRPRHSAS
jgi:hypothetical protein